MDLWNSLNSLANRAVELVSHVATEEATKTALVLPFLQCLGYDVFNPAEVVPEFTADVGIKKGEKVDYAICREGKPIILVECKPHGASLDSYSGQLFRYYSVTDARLAILTDGIVYRFYADLTAPNKLDTHPFMTLVLTGLRRDIVDQVECITRRAFDIEAILKNAEELRYMSQIKERFEAEVGNPSESLVRLLVEPIFKGRFTQANLERFHDLSRRAMSTFLTDAVDRRLRSAIENNKPSIQPASHSEDAPAPERDEIETTAEEVQGLYIVKAIVRDLVDPSRVVPRDVRSYFGILLDDNNRKPICRLWFNGGTKYVGVFDTNKTETRLLVNGPDGLFEHADAIRQSLQHVLKSSS